MSDPISDAVSAIAAGALIVMPTDTVYGIAARPDDARATDRLFAAKERPRALELPVLVASVVDARRVAAMDARADALAARWWPGGLTLVLPRTEASRAFRLGGDPDTIGVRIPDEPLARSVLERTGPLAVTSANRSGAPTPIDCDGVVEVFGDAVAVYLCAESPLSGRASTVIDLAHGAASVLREGVIPGDEVLASLARA